MKYQIEIKRTVSYTIYEEVNAEDEATAKEKALSEVKVKPIVFSKTTGHLIDSDTVTKVTECK